MNPVRVFSSVDSRRVVVRSIGFHYPSYFQIFTPFNPGAGSAEFPNCFILVFLVILRWFVLRCFAMDKRCEDEKKKTPKPPRGKKRYPPQKTPPEPSPPPRKSPKDDDDEKPARPKQMAKKTRSAYGLW